MADIALANAIPPELGLGNHWLQQGQATAEQMTSNGQGGNTTTVTLDNAAGGNSSFNPSLPGTETIKTLYRSNILNLDITDGFLSPLYLFKGYFTDTTASSQEITASFISRIPMNAFAGIRHQQDITDGGSSTDSSTRTFDTYTGDQQLTYYPWNRWLGTKIQLKDFNFIVERDSSGGLQMLNDPKFEVFFVPYRVDTNDGTNTNSFPNIPSHLINKFTGNRMITTFDNGLDITISGRSGWGEAPDMYRLETDSAVVRYLTFGEWQNTTTPLSTGIVFDANRAIQLDTPYYGVLFRWINRLVQTNVKVTMSYSIQIESTWQGCFKSLMYDTFFLPRPGVATEEPGLVSDKEPERKVRRLN